MATNTILATDTTSNYYHYLAANDTFIYCSTSDEANYPIVRYNYDGTGQISVYVDSSLLSVSRCKGIALYGDNVYAVSNTKVVKLDATNTHFYSGGSAWYDGATVVAQKEWVMSYGNGRGLAISDDGRYLYVTHQAQFITCIDTVTDAITYSSLSYGPFGANGVTFANNRLYIGVAGSNAAYESILTDPPTEQAVANWTGTDTSPYIVLYNSLTQQFYLCRYDGGIGLYDAVYTEGGYVQRFDACSTIVSDDSNVYGAYGHVKDGHFNVLYSNIDGSGNNTLNLYGIIGGDSSGGDSSGGGIGGDPIITTLSGEKYTVPDYLTEFNYLTYEDSMSGSYVVNCKTRLLTQDDFPNGMWDHDGEKYISLGPFDSRTCPHTYMDMLDANGELINMDGFESNALAPHGMPRTSRAGNYPLLDSTKYMEVGHGGLRLQIWSDTTVIDRHYVKVTVESGTITSGAITRAPKCVFNAIQSTTSTSRAATEDSICLNINGVDVCYKHNLPPDLLQSILSMNLTIRSVNY